MFFKTFRNIHRKTSVLESLFNKVAGIKAATAQVLSCKYCEIFKNSFLLWSISGGCFCFFRIYHTFSMRLNYTIMSVQLKEIEISELRGWHKRNFSTLYLTNFQKLRNQHFQFFPHTFALLTVLGLGTRPA